MNFKRVGIGAAALVAAGTVGGVVGNNCNGPGLTPPATIAADCSSDVGTALGAWLSSLPASSTVTLPSGACYLINSTVRVAGTTGLTVNGAGASLKRTVAGGTGQTIPLLFLVQDSTLALNGLTVTGAYNGSNGGGGSEGNYGLLVEAVHGLKVTGMAMSNVQGDFISLAPPNDTTGGDISLSTAVDIESSTFNLAGYHDLTVESVDGLTVNNCAFVGGNTAIDFEYDSYSTVFSPSGQAQQAAQDNVKITNDKWSGFANDWFASLQGQLPGVQQQNVTLSGNTIDAPSPLIEVTGTNPYLTPKQYWNEGLTVTNNHGLQPAISTHGGGAPGTEATMQIQAVVGLSITNNTLPLDQPNAPYLSVLQAFENQNMTITGNQFPGAFDVLEADSAANTPMTVCGNTFGVNGSQKDPVCS